MTEPQFPFVWNGEAMEPRPSFLKRANETFVVGESYIMQPVEFRSAASHKHYFAVINELWQTLPEADAQRFPSPEHLRKWALIKAGYCDQRSIVCASKAEAVRIAAFMKPLDHFAIVQAREAVVTVWTARSQSVKAMGRPDFQTSKDAVLAVIYGLLAEQKEAA